MQHKYEQARQQAERDRIPPCALPYLLASHRHGCDQAWDELVRGFAHLMFPIADRIAELRGEPQYDLLGIMFADLGRVLFAQRDSRLPAAKLEAHLRRELSYVLRHEEEFECRDIKDKHHGRDAGRLKNKSSKRTTYDDPAAHDFRRYRVKRWKKPRDFHLPLTVTDERERQRQRSGWYERYTSRALLALQHLQLSRDEQEILRWAAAGNSPEEIEKMTKFNVGYVVQVLCDVERWVAALSVA